MSERTGEGQYHYQVYELGERPVASVIQRVYAHLADLSEGSWVLDLGCGTGRFALNAPLPRVFRVLGIDQSPIAVARFQEAINSDGRTDEVQVGNITDLRLPKGREFRGAVSWRVIHALDFQQQRQVLDQVSQVLPAQASFFLAVASNQDWKVEELKARHDFNPFGLNDCGKIMGLEEPFKVHFFDQDQLEGLVTPEGFRVVQVESFTEPSGFDHLRQTHPDNTYLFAHLINA